MIESLIQKAAKFAQVAHEGQTRKYTGLPYITHPTRVAIATALHSFPNKYRAEWVAAAYLHDVLEDTDITFVQLLDEFPDNVVDIVVELTNVAQGNRETRKRLNNARLAKVSSGAKIIKMLDRVDNLTDIPPQEPFRIRYAKESKELLKAIGDADSFTAAYLQTIIESILCHTHSATE